MESRWCLAESDISSIKLSGESKSEKVKRAIIAVNPAAGQGAAGREIVRMESALAKEGFSCLVAISHKQGEIRHAAEMAVREEVDLFVVAGGDGSVNEAVNGLVGSNIPLGVLPYGTGNVLALDLRLPVDNVEDAACSIAHGKTTTVDLGKVNGRYFLLMAGIGFDAKVLEYLVPEVKDKLGKAAYAPAIIQALLRHDTTVYKLEVDGLPLELEASMIVVANGPSYGMSIKVAPHASMSDGLLDVILFERDNPKRLALIRQALNVITRKHDFDRSISQLTAKKVRIESEKPSLVQVDGDLAFKTPVEIEIVPSALKLISPSDCSPP